jgi:hypothetical protein
VDRRAKMRANLVVEPFFAEDAEWALLEQVNWLRINIELSDSFFSNLLDIDEEAFYQWRNQTASLPDEVLNYLREFWQVILHFLSLFDFDSDRLYALFYYEEKGRPIRLYLDPPWTGTSLKEYLQKSGPIGIREVDYWVQALRFANSY